MARPLEFNRDKALNNAMLLFWRQGYTATSLSQLLDAMQIGRSSFYAAFDDKRSLYIEVLRLFAERTCAILDAVRTEENPAQAVALFFEHTLFSVPKSRVQAGCMMINTVLELADVDNELSQLASQLLAQIEDAFADCFEQAIANGQISAQYDPAQLASLVMTFNKGLRVASRQKSNPQELRSTLDAMLQLLPMNTH
jgi:TetR/AcrR family transcriptional repressor of nem operon